MKFVNPRSFSVASKDYAVQKLLLYYDTPNQWPKAYDQTRVIIIRNILYL